MSAGVAISSLTISTVDILGQVFLFQLLYAPYLKAIIACQYIANADYYGFRYGQLVHPAAELAIVSTFDTGVAFSAFIVFIATRNQAIFITHLRAF